MSDRDNSSNERSLAEVQRDSNDLWQAIHREIQAGHGCPSVQMNRLHWIAALAEIEILRGALARVTFAKNRMDRCTWVLYLLEDEQISVGKAAEWLREYIRDAKEGELPPVHHYVGGEVETEAEHWLGELLAIIHGDGGHYRAEHGIEKAAKDAVEKLAQAREEKPVELWRGDRKVSIYAEEVMRSHGDDPKNINWEPRTLQSVQQALDWLYASPDSKPTLARELLSQCEAYHIALDVMFGLMIEKTVYDQPHCFYPTESGRVWEACTKGNALIQRARVELKAGSGADESREPDRSSPR